jgi:hypothetical protein
MKRVLLTVAVALLIPSILMAFTPTIGVYFDGKLTYSPPGIGIPFTAHLYLVQDGYEMTGVEYQLFTPDNNFIIDPLNGVFYPPGTSVALGDPLSGHSITYWPPLTGFPEGYDRLATYECVVLFECGPVANYTIVVGPHPDSGYLRGTYTPDNEFVELIGLTSYLCPEGVGTDEESWGAIKSMYDK